MSAQRTNRTLRYALGGTVSGLIALGVLAASLTLDRSARGDVDPILAELPAKRSDPFAETCAERLIRSHYKEPADEVTAAVPVASPKSRAINPDISDAARTKARRIYQERCASCHGDKGDGNGPGAFAVKPKPRDYTNADWQMTVTDAELAEAIVRGGAAIGKSYMMPANRDLKNKAEVVAALVELVRSFADPNP